MSGTGLRGGDRLPGLLGYEVDRVFDHAPAGTQIIAHSPIPYTGDTRYSDMVSYTLPNGVTVFATGSIQWSWGLDDFNVPGLRSSRLNSAAQQVTRNVLARLAGDAFPRAALDGPRHAKVGEEVQFDAAKSSDPDDGIVVYRWDFGDGTGNERVSPTHVFGSPGVYAVTLIVRDRRGAAADATVVLEVEH